MRGTERGPRGTPRPAPSEGGRELRIVLSCSAYTYLEPSLGPPLTPSLSVRCELLVSYQPICEQTAKKTPGICNFGLTKVETLKMSARVTAQARSTLAAAPAPAVCTLGVVRPRNECGILLRKVQLVRHTSQSRNRAKSADTHTNNRRGYE